MYVRSVDLARAIGESAAKASEGEASPHEWAGNQVLDQAEPAKGGNTLDGLLLLALIVVGTAALGGIAWLIMFAGGLAEQMLEWLAYGRHRAKLLWPWDETDPDEEG
jgi:hypothetical protein